MKMDIVAGSHNDEYLTPHWATKPIIKYLPTASQGGVRVWCPFDKDESFYVTDLRAAGYDVINTHIEYGQDFFETNIECEYIISNPPYSCKTEILERLFELDKPFAMLVGVVGLFESQKRFQMFRDYKFEIMYFNKRISFLENYEDEKPKVNPPFSSVYICHNILPKQIVFEEIER